MATNEIETGIDGIVRLPKDKPNTTANQQAADGQQKEEPKVKMYGTLPEDAYIETTQRPFVAFDKTTRMNNAELSKMIFAMFRKNFHDLAGVNVLYNGKFQVELYFEDNEDPIDSAKEIKNLVRIDKASGNGVYERMSAVYNACRSHRYTLNDETKLLLSSFMFGNRMQNLPNNKKWNTYINERFIPVASNFAPMPGYRAGDRVIVAVSGIDIHLVLRHLFGNTMVTSTDFVNGTETNYISDKVKYEVQFMGASYNGTFNINIKQFDEEAVAAYIAKEFPNFNNNVGVQMYNV